MGSDHHYPEEAPARRVRVEPFRIDVDPVTNARFARFVEETGHTTFAEIAPDPACYPGMPPEMAVPGSIVFVPPDGPVPPDAAGWWRWVPGADWRHPIGPGSDLQGLGDHPVVHVAHRDALAFARWAGGRLPSEAEWERAARGGLEGATYAWGEELEPGGRRMANIWRGAFPHRNDAAPEERRTSAVGSFPPNGFGLHDMIGNVWEWTATPYADRPADAPACCAAAPPAGEMPVMVTKGGSHLCAPSYCRRYRPAARWPQPTDTTTSHLGFRCVADGGGPG